MTKSQKKLDESVELANATDRIIPQLVSCKSVEKYAKDQSEIRLIESAQVTHPLFDISCQKCKSKAVFFDEEEEWGLLPEEVSKTVWLSCGGCKTKTFLGEE